MRDVLSKLHLQELEVIKTRQQHEVFKSSLPAPVQTVVVSDKQTEFVALKAIQLVATGMKKKSFQVGPDLNKRALFELLESVPLLFIICLIRGRGVTIAHRVGLLRVRVDIIFKEFWAHDRVVRQIVNLCNGVEDPDVVMVCFVTEAISVVFIAVCSD